MTLTPQQRRAARRAYKAVVWFDNAMDDLCSDPMTAAMGAPVADFAHDWAGRHRKMLADCLDDPANTEQTRNLLMAEMERYFP